MKKMLSLLFMGLLLLTGCSAYDLQVTKVEIPNSKFVEIKEINPQQYCIDVVIKNKTNKTLEIVWDKSRVGDDYCFLRGRYIDAGKSQMNDIILPSQTKDFSIYPASKIVWSQYIGWYQVYADYPTSLILCIKKDNQEEFLRSIIVANRVKDKK